MKDLNKPLRVLDKGFVEIQEVMGSDHVIANCARVSFNNEMADIDKVKDENLLRRLMVDRHTSPFETGGAIRFGLRVPIIVVWQLVRHRTFSLNIQSGRYKKYDENEFYMPSFWRGQHPTNKQMSEGEIEDIWFSKELEAHYVRSYELYQNALKEGVSREMARLFLPAFGLYISVVAAIDVHNLMHFLRLRLANDAQYEIQQVAKAMQLLFKEAFPVTGKLFEESLAGTLKK